MTWKVELETRARTEFLKLKKDMRKIVGAAIDSLGSDARPRGCKKLVAKEGFRLRKGDWRVLYTIDDSLKLVRVYRIGHRREVYRGG